MALSSVMINLIQESIPSDVQGGFTIQSSTPLGGGDINQA